MQPTSNQSVPAAALTKPVYDKVSGNYEISARYCEPARRVLSRSNIAQLLVQGFTFNKGYWPALGYQPTRYSWIDYALNQGYHKLSVDRLGSGFSRHPNPVADVQLPLEVNIISEIILEAKSGNFSSGLSEIWYMSVTPSVHILAMRSQLSILNAESFDAFILTGYSARLADNP
jgi:hypothetical protein